MFKKWTRRARRTQAEVRAELEPMRVEAVAEHRAELTEAALAVERARVAREQTAALRDRLDDTTASLRYASPVLVYPVIRIG